MKTAGRSGEHSGKEDGIQSTQGPAPASYRVGALTIDVGLAQVAGRAADAARLFEQTLKLDPLDPQEEWNRRSLIRVYVSSAI